MTSISRFVNILTLDHADSFGIDFFGLVLIKLTARLIYAGFVYPVWVLEFLHVRLRSGGE